VNGLCQNHASRASLPLSSLKGPVDHTATGGSPSTTTCPRGSSPTTTKGSTLINNYRRRFLTNHCRNCSSPSLSSSLLSSTIKITPQLNPLSSLLRSTKTCNETTPQHQRQAPFTSTTSPPSRSLVPVIAHRGLQGPTARQILPQLHRDLWRWELLLSSAMLWLEQLPPAMGGL
jgi:hypothetical protein